jgi:uncharacterized membrane protein
MKSNLENYHPYKFFLITGLILGLIYSAINPPFHQVDEYSHFMRVMQLGKGYLIDGFELQSHIENTFNNCAQRADKSINKDCYKTIFDKPINDLPPIYIGGVSASAYTPIVYFPAVIVAAIADNFNLSGMLLLYLFRISLMIVGVLIAAYAIKISPILNWPLIFLMLCPMINFLRGSVTADTITISLSLLLISYLLKILKQDHIDNKIKLVLFTLTTIMALCKSSYCLISFVVLIIPIKHFGSLKQYIIWQLIFILPGQFTNLLWTIYIQQKFYGITPSAVAWSKGVNSVEQLKFIVSYPWEAFKIIISSSFISFFRTMKFFADPSFHITKKFPSYYSYSYIVSLIILYIRSSSNILLVLHSRQKLFLNIIFVSNIILIICFLYLQWTPVGNKIVYGFQSKYLFPLLPILMVGLYQENNLFKFDLAKWSIILSLVFNVITFFKILKLYI